MTFKLGIGPGKEIVMRVNMAHLRERGRSGGWINFAVFDARSSSGTHEDNSRLLAQLTARARAANFRIDQSVLAYMSSGRTEFFGSPPLVDYLSNTGITGWTHTIEV
jgi:hypothetical protein